MKNKILKNISLLLFFVFSLVLFFNLFITKNEINANAFSTTAKSMALMEMESGRLLAGKNQNEKMKMASTTKIATAITVLDNCSDLDTPFRVDDRAIGVEGTSIYLQKGEILSARQLLYGLMLRSGNDASVALALHCAKSISDFANLMNETAKKVGATNTNFTNSHGLDDANHYTTAYDLALITSYALKNKTFRDIVSTQNYKIPHPEYKTRFLHNKNRLLGNLDGCIGVKTGFTKGAGRCFVGAVERKNTTLVCVVLNCGPMFEECADILNEGFNKYKNEELISPYSYIRSIDVENGKKAKVKIYCPKGFSYPLSNEEKSLINITYDLPNSIEAPIKQETKIGKVSIYFKDKILFESDLLTMEEVESEKILEQIKDIVDKW